MSSSGTRFGSDVYSIPAIVVAEDDDDMRELVRCAIQAAGFRVIALSNGQQMLDFVVGMTAGTIRVTPVAIVSDICMPKMSGIEILKVLRGGSRRIPVILMTAFGDSEALVEAQACGVSHILYKPFRMADLVRVIFDVLGIGS